jgi:hypothetical protein
MFGIANQEMLFFDNIPSSVEKQYAGLMQDFDSKYLFYGRWHAPKPTFTEIRCILGTRGPVKYFLNWTACQVANSN